jgi:hypothetical protein
VAGGSIASGRDRNAADSDAGHLPKFIVCAFPNMNSTQLNGKPEATDGLVQRPDRMQGKSKRRVMKSQSILVISSADVA